jgi:hypothetical protein
MVIADNGTKKEYYYGKMGLGEVWQRAEQGGEVSPNIRFARGTGRQSQSGL